MLSALKPKYFDGAHVTAVLGNSEFYSRAHQPEIPDCAHVLTPAIADDDGAYDQHIFLVSRSMTLSQDLTTSEPYRFPVDAANVIILPAKGRFRARYMWPLSAEPVPLSDRGRMEYILERRHWD